MSHSLRRRFANSLGVTYQAHSCCRVPGLWLVPDWCWGILALPRECARHVPFAQTPLRELARCDTPDTLLLRSAGFLFSTWVW